MKQFHSQIINLKKLYHNSFRIPDYQRLYSWSKDEIKELWQDLHKASVSYKTSKNNYFLGTIIVCRDPKSGSLNLIDGQQRTTALIILLNIIKKNYLQDETIHIPKLQVQKEIRSDFKTHIKSPKTYENYKNIIHTKERSPKNSTNTNIITNRDLRQDNVADKYKIAISYFMSKLDELSDGLDELLAKRKISNFYNFLLKHTYFNLVESTDEAASIRLFQTLNTRGQSLSDSAIFKSYILGKCQDSKTATRERRKFNNFWHNNIENFLSNFPKYRDQLHFNANDCVHCYVYYKLRAIPKKDMSAELLRTLDNENSQINQVITNFEQFFTCLDNLIPAFEDDIVPLFYLPWRLYIITILSLIEKNRKAQNYTDTETQQLIFAIRRCYYVHLINSRTAHSIRTISINLIKSLTEGHSVSKITQDLIEKHLTRDGAIQKAKAVLNEEVYRIDEPPRKFIKPILLWLEYDKTKEFHLANNTIDIDHIYPKSGSELLSSKFRLGNLALLEDSLNKSVQDEKDFKNKMYKILNGIPEKNINPCKFATTRAVYESSNNLWNETTIEARHQEMKEGIYRPLDLDH